MNNEPRRSLRLRGKSPEIRDALKIDMNKYERTLRKQRRSRKSPSPRRKSPLNFLKDIKKGVPLRRASRKSSRARRRSKRQSRSRQKSPSQFIKALEQRRKYLEDSDDEITPSPRFSPKRSSPKRSSPKRSASPRKIDIGKFLLTDMKKVQLKKPIRRSPIKDSGSSLHDIFSSKIGYKGNSPKQSPDSEWD